MIQAFSLGLQSVGGETDGISHKGGGIDDIGTCLRIGFLQFNDCIRMLGYPLFGADTLWHTGFHQIGARRSVENQCFISKAFRQFFFCHYVPPFYTGTV